jgi:Na+-translocating ferredoxin:NAD+ oxidoreductase RnfC subunit
VPIGVRLSDCIGFAGKIKVNDPIYMKNGIMMASFGDNFDDIVTKTTAGYVILDRNHPLVRSKTEKKEVYLRVGKSSCDQCSYCTELCPRYLLGHKVKPHMVMRSLLFSPERMENLSRWASGCVECGLCGLYSCPEGLSPHLIMGYVKGILRKNGTLFEPDENSTPHSMREFRKAPTSRIIKRLGLSDYDLPAPYIEADIRAELYYFPMKQHIGVPAEPIVKVGQMVRRGEYIGDIGEGLSAYIVSSVDGIVESVSEEMVVIRRS